WVELSTVRITWEGRPATLNILRDITEQRRLEERLRETQKMETMGMLASGVAHDFNNLLMGITGYISLVLLDLDPKDPKYKKLKEIEQYADSGTQLVKQLMRLAAGEKYQVESANLNEIIKKISWLFGRIRKNMAIETKYEEALWMVDVDGSEMEQVFLNLFVNASQAMDGTGRLYVNTENVVLGEPEASAKGLSPGRYVKCVVADTGKGMDEETLKRLFDPFFTTKEKGLGTGLGLTVVHTIVKNHGGVIEVHSKKGEGSIFTIHLPVSEKILPSYGWVRAGE
ncbi:MAG: hybrid sensor histidine kinase/response regulator, partial [Deltaproteobacteria bacterium]|nr:hybrid sensor histidine kinase/response regulator [Deltaproteobacteria bacterium]